MRTKESVLCYWPEGGAHGAAPVQQALLPLGVRLRRAGPEDSGRTVGELLGLEAPGAAEEVPPVPDPILVFAGFTSARLQAALMALRRRKAPQSVFKAVLTPDNAGWTLRQLWEELSREREALSRGERAEHGGEGGEEPSATGVGDALIP